MSVHLRRASKRALRGLALGRAAAARADDATPILAYFGGPGSPASDSEGKMKFEHQGFVCDVDVFHNNIDLFVRFYNKAREHNAEEIKTTSFVEYNGEY